MTDHWGGCMAIAMTEQQKEDLNRTGFFVVENLLSADEVAAVAAAMDQVAAEVRAERGLGPGDTVGLRNGMIRHPKLLDLMDHPKILELVVDAYGWNIHNRDSVTLCAPPAPAGSDPDILSLGWHFDYWDSACPFPSYGSSRAARRCAERTRPSSARGAAEPGARTAPCPASRRRRHCVAARRGRPRSLDPAPRIRPVPRERVADRPDQSSRVF